MADVSSKVKGFVSELNGSLQIAVLKRPIEGHHCGDQAGFWEHGKRLTLCMIDGLGHGKNAEKAAMAAMDVVERHHTATLPDIFEICDRTIRHTRGVAMGIALVDQDGGTITYAGVGNTRAMIVGGDETRLSSSYGIVGAGYRALKPETVPLDPGGLVVMYTDGIEEAIDISGYDEAIRRDVDGLAAAILHDWSRETDDVAVMVFRNGRI